MRSRVTTRKGDEGMSRALDGEVYAKSHPLMEAVGAVDELRAQTAMLRQLILTGDRPEKEALGAFLLWLLHTYFLIGTECSDPTRRKPEYRVAELEAKHLKKLEQEQLRLEKRIDFAKAFIAGAATVPAAQADLVCTAVRRLERSLIRLKEAVPLFDAERLLPFVNRLSDYFFVLARDLEDGRHIPVDYGLLER